MSAAPHDRHRQAPTERPDDGVTAAAPADDPVEARMSAAQRWLVDELRDECSEIGVGARGFDLDAFLAGVAVFAREARRLGAAPERMLVLLKSCLSDDALPSADREQYRLYVDRAVTAAVRAYYGDVDVREAGAALPAR